ncbi:MAG: DUF1385 domain-containing protein [Lachnospiraceae bacterium]|nr:DUF1385 domain-containing protein [Lachnospiraceae bacterium]
MRPSGIGGQAVIEGVMMKNGSKYAVAVRKPDKEIEIKTNTLSTKKSPAANIPVVRGVLAFVDSLSLGMKTLNFSASFYEEEEEESKFEQKLNKITKGHADGILTGFTMVLAILLAVGIFVVVPMLLAGFLAAKIENQTLLAVLEGVFRLLIFIVYIGLISRVKDIQRVFMYHGAEHKTINCIENGLPLTVENVRKQSREHKRCGTSFMLTVMVISIIFFIFIRIDHTVLRFVVRLLLIPVIAGVSYEFIRLAGRTENKLVNVLSRPGMWLQALTTREPDDSMIEVAIASVEAVFDWQKFLDKENRKKNRKNSKKQAEEEQKQSEAAAAEEIAAVLERIENPKSEAGKKKKAEKSKAEVKKQGKTEKPEMEEKEQETPVQEKPAEVDLAQMFDMKLTMEPKEIRHGRAPKKDPMPSATRAVSAAKEDEDDDILKALDMYFEFQGTKSVMEISDEVPEEDTKG